MVVGSGGGGELCTKDTAVVEVRSRNGVWLERTILKPPWWKLLFQQRSNKDDDEVITAAEYPEQLGHSCNTTKDTTEAIQLESLGNGTENTNTEDGMVRVTDSGKNQIEQATKKKSMQAIPRSDATISRPLKRPKKGHTAEYKGGPKIEIGQCKEYGTRTTRTKKKRGRPHKLLADIQKSSGTDAVGKDCSSDEVELSKTTNVNPRDAVGKECSSNEVELSTTTNVNPTDAFGKDCSSDEVELSKTTNVNPTDAVGKDCSSNEVELPTTTNVNPTGSQDASIGKIAEVSQTDCRREKDKMAITEITFDMTQPLHMCSEEISSSTKLDDSRFSSGGAVNQLNEANERIGERPLIDCTHNNVLGLNQKLPFVKSSPIWKMIDSMEIFKTMQQYPRFHPLYNVQEEVREGLAIGTMVTFANLVEKTSKLQLDDPRSIWVSLLEVLPELEKHGLDVQVLRDRLNKQLVIKNIQEQNLEELKKLEIQLLQKKNTKTDEEIDKLKENIRVFKEKLASAMSMKKIKDSETAALQLIADDKREGIRSNQLDFERVTAAPLLIGL